MGRRLRSYFWSRSWSLGNSFKAFCVVTSWTSSTEIPFTWAMNSAEMEMLQGSFRVCERTKWNTQCLQILETVARTCTRERAGQTPDDTFATLKEPTFLYSCFLNGGMSLAGRATCCLPMLFRRDPSGICRWSPEPPVFEEVYHSARAACLKVSWPLCFCKHKCWEMSLHSPWPLPSQATCPVLFKMPKDRKDCSIRFRHLTDWLLIPVK